MLYSGLNPKLSKILRCYFRCASKHKITFIYLFMKQQFDSLPQSQEQPRILLPSTGTEPEPPRLCSSLLRLSSHSPGVPQGTGRDGGGPGLVTSPSLGTHSRITESTGLGKSFKIIKSSGNHRVFGVERHLADLMQHKGIEVVAASRRLP